MIDSLCLEILPEDLGSLDKKNTTRIFLAYMAGTISVTVLPLGLARHSTSKTSNGLEMLRKSGLLKEGTEEGIKVFPSYQWMITFY